jgi:hypothetical protein
MNYYKCFSLAELSSNLLPASTTYLVLRELDDNNDIKEDGRQIIDLVLVSEADEVIRSTRIQSYPFDEKGTNFIDKVVRICPEDSQFLFISSNHSSAFKLTVVTDEKVEITPFLLSCASASASNNEDRKQTICKKQTKKEVKLETKKFLQNFNYPDYREPSMFLLSPSKKDYILAAKKITTWTKLPIELTMIIVHMVHFSN